MTAPCRFSIGPWNIARGADPFGPPVRPAVSFDAVLDVAVGRNAGLRPDCALARPRGRGRPREQEPHRGFDVPTVGVGGGYGWYDPQSGVPSISTDNAAIDPKPFVDHGVSPRRSRATAMERIVVPPIGVVARASTDTVATKDEAIVLVLRWLRANPSRKPDVVALAAEASVSRSTLETRFRAVVGRSIHEEFVKLRLAGLRRLITETDLPLKTIATRAGFPSLQ